MVVRRWWLGSVFTACTCLVSCILVANVAKWWCDCGGFMIDCGVFCRGCGGFHVFFRRLRGGLRRKRSAKTAKLWCGNGEMVVRRWWLGFAISVEIHCVAAVVVFAFWHFQPLFLEFHKAFHRSHIHFTANQHHISTFSTLKTAISALEQAK